MSAASVHEAVEVEGPVGKLDACIEHFTESDLSKVLLKIDHYSTLGAREAFNQGKRATVWGAIFRADLAFVQNYFLRLAFLDGAPGLVLAATDATNKFFKYAKLSDLTKAAQKNK